jgi:hypothetical protein
MALPAVAMGILLLAGCGPSTTNDENLTGTAPTSGSGGPGVKSYGDFAKRQAEKDAQAQAEAKKSKSKTGSKAKP